MADPMQTAVEVLARALWLAEEGHAVSYPADAMPITETGRKAQAAILDRIQSQARALLAEIAPLIRAEEREACAKVVEAEAHEECDVAEQIAAAIRQRGNE